jgi:hypothetical protein
MRGARDGSSPPPPPPVTPPTRAFVSAPAMPASSPMRPTKPLSSAGRFDGRVSNERNGGNTRSPTWKTRSGVRRPAKR